MSRDGQRTQPLLAPASGQTLMRSVFADLFRVKDGRRDAKLLVDGLHQRSPWSGPSISFPDIY